MPTTTVVGYLILGTWYREPFCHQMGPYQTLRAHTLCTQLLVTFRVFFYFKNHQNHKNRSQHSRGVLFCEKKGPCQECPGCRRNWFSQEIPNSKISDKKNTIFRKGTRGKMTPQVFSIQCQSPFLFFSRNPFILKEIAKTYVFIHPIHRP